MATQLPVCKGDCAVGHVVVPLQLPAAVLGLVEILHLGNTTAFFKGTVSRDEIRFWHFYTIVGPYLCFR